MGSEALKIGTSVTKDSSEMIENSTGAKKNFHLFKLIRNCPVESLFTQKISVPKQGIMSGKKKEFMIKFKHNTGKKGYHRCCDE